jgi:tRNA G18 (ribose-2'-O)-methylase SpoU
MTSIFIGSFLGSGVCCVKGILDFRGCLAAWALSCIQQFLIVVSERSFGRTVAHSMTITRIFDFSDHRIDAYARLTERQLRNALHPEDSLVVCESLYVIRLAALVGLDFVSVLVDERHLENLLDTVPELGEKDIDVYVASREVLGGITGFQVTRGYFACVRRPPARQAADVLADARRVAVIEGLTNVTNVGAVFRSAAALGVDAMLLSPECADPLSRRSIRVSMGTVFQVPWAVAEGDWPASAFGELERLGFDTVALALDDRARRLDDPSLAGRDRLAPFFGTEGTGLTRDVLERVDEPVIIPMSHGVDSLNVAASSAVAFWELCAKGRRSV